LFSAGEVVGHQRTTEVNDGVWINDGSGFLAVNNEAIKGTLVIKETGQVLNGDSSIYVTKNMDAPLDLVAKGDVFVSVQPNAQAVSKVANQLANSLRTYKDSRGFDNKVSIIEIKILLSNNFCSNTSW